MTYCAFDSLEISTCVRVLFLRHTSPFTALQHDAHLHINSHQPPSHHPPSLSLLPHPQNTQTGAQGGRCARRPPLASVSTRQLAHGLAADLCVETQHTHTHAGSDTHILTGDLLPLVLCFFFFFTSSCQQGSYIHP